MAGPPGDLFRHRELCGTGGGPGRVEALTSVPENLDLLPAAALVHDGVTATGLLERTAVTATDRVLILGASGGMGTLLVQPAHERGARVVGVARGAAKLALLRDLGADTTVDATAPDWPTRARHALGGSDGMADVVLDGVGGELGPAAFPLTAKSGRFSAHGAPSGSFATLDPTEAERRGITLFGIQDVQFSEADLNRLTAHALAEAAAGRLRPVIGEVFALEGAGAAHGALEGRQLLGKVLLEC
ncbi:zinc-binding dehydrogenase [Streptomyces sp. NPDC050704]|uniref:zinc-binding dehydrogenase n=1 Tax=Streptomyces sp. NPDC050704 TaxID=3157219 RepID=UPI0034177B78